MAKFSCLLNNAEITYTKLVQTGYYSGDSFGDFYANPGLSCVKKHGWINEFLHYCDGFLRGR